MIRTPAIDDNDLSGVLRGGLREPRDHNNGNRRLAENLFDDI